MEKRYMSLVNIAQIQSIEEKEDAYLLHFDDGTYLFATLQTDKLNAVGGCTYDTLDYILTHQHYSAVRLEYI